MDCILRKEGFMKRYKNFWIVSNNEYVNGLIVKISESSKLVVRRYYEESGTYKYSGEMEVNIQIKSGRSPWRALKQRLEIQGIYETVYVSEEVIGYLEITK